MDLLGWFRKKDDEEDLPIVIEDIESMTNDSIIRDINDDFSHEVRNQISSHPVDSTPKVSPIQTKVEITKPQLIEVIEPTTVTQEVVLPTVKPSTPPKRYDDGFTSCRNMY